MGVSEEDYKALLERVNANRKAPEGDEQPKGKGRKGKRSGARSYPEHDLQRICVAWFRNEYPELVLYHVPNGMYVRSKRIAGIWKELGRLSGIPDLVLAAMRGGWGGLYIEMKAGAGTSSEKQEDVQERLRREGYLVVEVRTFEQFKLTVNGYLKGKNIRS